MPACKCKAMYLIDSIRKNMGLQSKNLSICVLDSSEGLHLQQCVGAGQGFPDLLIQINRLKKCTIVELKLCVKSSKSFKHPDKSPLIDAEEKFQRITHLNFYHRCFKYIVLPDNVKKPGEEIKRLEKQGIYVVSLSEFVRGLFKRDC